MLAGCSSSSLLSPRHGLRSEAPAQFQACHFQLPSMSTQSLDLPPCTFPRKDASRSQPIRPQLGISTDKPIEGKKTTLKQNIRRPPSPAFAQTTTGFIEGRLDVKDEFWERGKKRYLEHESYDESCVSRVKRKRGCANVVNFGEGSIERGDNLSLGQLGSGNFWFDSPQVPFSVSYSGDEERVYYVPSEVISSPLPSPNNPWVESVVKKITVLGDKNVEEIGHVHVKVASGSSNSSQSHSSKQRIYDQDPTSEQETESANPYQHENELVEVGEEDDHEEHKGLELIASLMGCVEAIGSKNVVAINHFIAKLGGLASPKGTSSISRLVAYYTEALALRIIRVWPNIFHITIPREFHRFEDDSGTALRLFNQVNPIPKFIHFTANEMLLRAFEGKGRVHIIDFDIKQGLQWPSLFQSLASSPNPPTHVRITGVGESKQELNETGDRLSGFAEALNLSFEFHPVVDKLEDVRLWMLHVKEKETVAVNCIFQLHKTLYDENALMDVLGTIRSTNPTTVVMVEQEGEHNDPKLQNRVCNSLEYYSAIFDSIDSSNLPLESSVRVKIEEMFAGEIRNIVACEGRERNERHECFTTWKILMGKGGFRCMKVGDREIVQSKMLLKMFSSDKFFVRKGGEEGEAITLNWENQPLYTVSAWTPIEIAGSSSSFSQPI